MNHVTEPIAFTMAALAILATPGPTNTLLATSGAAAGFVRSIHLILAEAVGYLISISVLGLLVGPLVRASHTLSIGLRLGCALFLFASAWKLWREGGVAIASGAPVSFRRLFIATLLNPKGIVFAFVIVPFLAVDTIILAAPYLVALTGLIVLAGGSWIAGGAMLRAGARGLVSEGAARRGGALVLCVFATLISVSTFRV